MRCFRRTRASGRRTRMGRRTTQVRRSVRTSPTSYCRWTFALTSTSSLTNGFGGRTTALYGGLRHSVRTLTNEDVTHGGFGRTRAIITAVTGTRSQTRATTIGRRIHVCHWRATLVHDIHRTSSHVTVTTSSMVATSNGRLPMSLPMQGMSILVQY